jgi:hypothetical protein
MYLDREAWGVLVGGVSRSKRLGLGAHRQVG